MPVEAGLAAFYTTMGRPSIDPELMIRMLIIGYCSGIRSERRLCEEIHLNLAYCWFVASNSLRPISSPQSGPSNDQPDSSRSTNRLLQQKSFICIGNCGYVPPSTSAIV